MRYTLILTAAAAVLLLLSSCSTRLPEGIEDLLVERVDITRYAGLWYQVGRYPHSFQKGPCGDSTAEYTLRDSGRINVLNRCWEGEYGGSYRQQVRAVARVVNDAGSHLRVVFFNVFPASYLIIELDEVDYQWAAVTTPKKNTLWILSRSPRLDDDIYAMIVDRLAAKGFDPDRIMKTSRQ